MQIIFFCVSLFRKQKGKEMTQITEVLEAIKEQLGLDLKLCDYFTGVKELGGKQYFNVVLNKRVSESQDFTTLKRFSDKYKSINVEPNGINRVAIFF